jgi:uncharacterized repeat protein (TIGR01451 family)
MHVHIPQRARRLARASAVIRNSWLLSADQLECRTLLSVITPFTPRFTMNATGDIAIVANTLMTAPSSDPAAANAQNGVGSKVNNNDFNMVFVNVDSDPSTFNSSSSSLSLPAGSTVLFAGLYWGGRNPSQASLEDDVKFATPSSGGYVAISGSVIGTSNTSNGSDYESFADVTSRVAAAGNGTYTVANVQASAGVNVYAGWALVVAYQAPGVPLRNLTVFDGYASINSGDNPVTGSISGFIAPPVGTVNAKVGVVAYEGDRGFTGDSMSLNGAALGDSLNPSTNFFNSTISNLGVAATAKTPNYINQLGFDAKIVDATGDVPNGATSATFQLQTDNDQYFPGVVTTAIDLYAPQLVGTKSETDLTQSGPVQPGDLIQYAMTVTNTGKDGAKNTVVTDLIPANTTYVPGTLRIAAGANSGAKTDVAGDDQAEYVSAGNRVVFRVGTGASATSGGVLAIGDSTTIQFQVRVNSGAVDGTVVNNQATITATAVTSGLPVSALSSIVSLVVHPLADLSLQKTINNPTPNVGDGVSYTVKLANIGPSPATNVQVTDLLPSGLTFVSATPSQGTYSSSTGLWTVGTVTTTASPTLVIQATVASASPLTNVASVTHSDQADPNTANNSASATDTPQQANLGLAKTVSNLTPNVGDTVTFTVVLTNTGPNTATNAQVTDKLPAGLTFVTATPSQGTYNSTSGLWTVGTVTTSAPQTLVITAMVASPAAQTNSATITHSDQFDPNTSNTTASATETPQQADLVLAKSVDNPTPNVNDTITYTITLADNGPNTATNVQVSDVLPSGLVFVTATPSQGTYNAVTGVWNVGSVDTIAPRTLRIRATVTNASATVNTATIAHADQFDPVTTNNTATSSSTPLSADLSVTKTVSSSTPNVGDTISYTVTLRDNGPNDATNVTLGDPLPAGLTFVSATPSQGTYDPASGIWTVGGVANQSSAVLTVRATVESPNPETNVATITHSDQFDPNLGNNTASTLTTPQQADLVLAKAVSNSTPNVGDTITYIVTVRDDGPGNATGVTVSDLLPAGVSFVSATPSQGSYDSGTGRWTVGNVNLSTAQTLTIQARVASATPATNTAAITHIDQFDPNTANNSASVTETPQIVDLALSKSVSNNIPNVGNAITYIITLTNIGPNTSTNVATSVVVQDALPAGLNFRSATASQGSYNSTTGLWNVGSVTTGTSQTLTILAQVVSPNPQTNTAAITNSDQFDPNTANNTASVLETPQLADLAVAKTVSNPTPNVGDTITYTVTLTDHGPDVAANAQVTDLLPQGLFFVSAAPSQGTYDPTTGLWDVGTVVAATPQTLVIQARVDSPNPQTNAATITNADQFDPVTANNTASVVETPRLANLVLAKTVDDPTPNVGDKITFTVTITNTGPDNATNVVITDLLPQGLLFVSATPSQGTYDPVTGLWNVGTVNTANPQTLLIQATVLGSSALLQAPEIPVTDAPAEAPIVVSPQTNTAAITHSDQFDPNSGNITASATETPQQADLVLSKNVDNPTANVGDTITYTITLGDNGPDAATNVRVSDPLPSGLLFMSAIASQGVYDPLDGLWTVGTVDTTAPRTLRIEAQAISAGSTINTATITHADQFDPVSANNTATTTEDPLQVDLAVTKSVDNPTPNVGDTITYTIALTDNSTNNATNVTVQDILPAGLTFDSATPSQGTYDPASGIWTVGGVANQSSAVLTVRAKVISPNPETNVATITHSDQFDPNVGNNTASTLTTPQQADLAVTKGVSNATPNVGETITFIVTVRDDGPNNATGVSVQDLVPAGFSIVSATPSQGTYDGGTGVWSVGNVNLSTAQTLTILATVTGPNPATNAATIAHADQFDPISANNSASVLVVPQQADLAVTKTVSNATPNVDDTITYTITLTNNGPDTSTNAATGIRVTEPLPIGLVFVSATPSQGAFDPTTGVWNVGTVNASTSQSLVILAKVVSPTPTTDTVTISQADQFDPNPGNNTATAVETPQQSDLVLTKTVDKPAPNVGDNITYTITVANNGPDPASNVNVSDVLPPGLAPISINTSIGTYNSGTGIWAVGSVASGTPETLQITARVMSPNASTNSASITHSDQFDPDLANNTASIDVTPEQADLAVTKTVSDQAPNVGETITYTITLSDIGPDSATSALVADLLPSGVSFVSATPSQGAYDPATGLWSVGTVNVGSPLTLLIRATVDSPDSQTNTATISSADQFDPISTNNTASTTTTPQQADLALAKTVSNTTPNVGDTITYTITLSDNGPNSATNAQVTDVLPSGVSFVGATPSQGTFDSATGVWTAGTVNVGSPLTLAIQAMVVSAAPNSNQAAITNSDQFDPNPGNNNASVAETPQQADLVLTKTTNDLTPNVNDTVTFTISLANLGPGSATNVAVADVLPVGLAFVSATPSTGTTYDLASGVWSVGTVDVGTPLTLLIQATVVSPNSETNTATISHSDQFDPNPANNTAAVTQTPQQADLSLSKSVDDPSPNVNETITYTVTLGNNGPVSATNVEVTDLLPSGVTFVSAAPSLGTYDSTSGLWSVGTVNVGSPLTLLIRATVDSPDSQTNTATISNADQFDPVAGNNTASVVETPQQSDLVLTKDQSDATPNVGDTITYTVTLNNNGPNDATNVEVTDALPAGVSFVSANTSAGTYDPASGVWTVGTVATTVPQSLAIQAKVTSPDAQTNTATITQSDQFDPNTANNTDSVTQTPQQADLALTKTVSNSAPEVGETITYIVTLTNKGPDAATNVQVTDLLPAGVSFVSATPSQGTYNSVSGLWTISSVATSAPQTLTLTGTVVGAAHVINTATVTNADQFDPDPSNNAASAPDTPLQADLALSKSVNDATPNVGDTITYTVTLKNNGPNNATNVQVRDLLPDGVSFVSATPSEGTYDSITGLWSVGIVTGSVQQTLALRVIIVSPDQQTNTASIAHSDQFDPNTENDIATTSVMPQQADLALAKIVDDPTPSVGDTVTFTITLSNNGPDAATNVQVTEALPAGVSFVSAIPSQGTYNPATGLWSAGTVATGAPQTLVIKVTIVSDGAQTNTATITHADQYDPSPTNNTDGLELIGISPEVMPGAAPSVTSLKRFGFHAQPTEFVLAFSSALDPARAQDPNNYTLKPVGPHGHLGARIRIVAAVYHPLTHTVTLHPATRLYLFQRYKLVVNGMPPAGLAGPSGVLLDGRGNGISGTDYVKNFGPGILAGPYRRVDPAVKHETRHLTSAHTKSSTTPLRSHPAASGRRLERTHTPAPKVGIGRLPADAVDVVLGTLDSPLGSRHRDRRESRDQD